MKKKKSKRAQALESMEAIISKTQETRRMWCRIWIHADLDNLCIGFSDKIWERRVGKKVEKEEEGEVGREGRKNLFLHNGEPRVRSLVRGEEENCPCLIFSCWPTPLADSDPLPVLASSSWNFAIQKIAARAASPPAWLPVPVQSKLLLQTP